MSYAMAAALQAAVFDRLATDTPLQALVPGAVFDVAPPGPLPPLYLVIGPEEAIDRSDASAHGALHRFTVSVFARESGFASAKEAAAAACDCLLGAGLTLARGRLVSMSFERASARRDGSGDTRRIDLRFAARLDES